jgi:hypothetical protein
MRLKFGRVCFTLLLLCSAAVCAAAAPMNPNVISVVGSGLLGVPVDVDGLGNHAYVTSDAGLFDLDFTQRGEWSLVDSLELPTGAGKVALHGNLIYVTSTTPGAGVRIIGAEGAGGMGGMAADRPAGHGLEEIGSYEFDGFPADLAVLDDLGYVADPENGLVRIFDADGVGLGEEVNTFPYPALALAVKGDYAYVSGPDALGVFDVTDPVSPLLLGECSTPTGAAAVATRDGWVYLAELDAGLVIVDAQTPSGPMVTATVPFDGDVYDVALHGGYAFVAAGLAGLRVLDITSPTAPAEVGFYQTVGEAIAVAIHGDRIYVVDTGAGLVFLRNAPAFWDVDGDHWAYAQIQACYRADIVAGYPDGNYKPDEPVNRAQMAVYAARAAAGGDANVPESGTQSFSDVAGGHWAHRYVEYVAQQGITEGYPDGGYHPGETVNRAQMAVYMARLRAGGDAAVGEPTGAPSFPDIEPSHWAYRYIEYAKNAGIVQGFPDGNYHPGLAVTRDQMAVFVARTFDLPM